MSLTRAERSVEPRSTARTHGLLAAVVAPECKACSVLDSRCTIVAHWQSIDKQGLCVPVLDAPMDVSITMPCCCDPWVGCHRVEAPHWAWLSRPFIHHALLFIIKALLIAKAYILKVPKLTTCQTAQSRSLVARENQMASTCSSPSGTILSLPQHIQERIIAAAGTGFCGAALSCRALLSAWRTALATDPRLAASMLLSRAAVIDDPRQRASWIVSQLYSSRSEGLPPAALQRPETTPRDVKRNERASKGLLSSPRGGLVRALASDQERSDYATVFVREMPPQVLELARSEWAESSSIVDMKGGIGAMQAASFRHIGVTVEQLLRGSPTWATVIGACKAKDARVLGACVAAHRASVRTRSDDASHGLSDLGNEHTWRQPSGDRLTREAWLAHVQSAACLAVVLLGLQHDLAVAARHFVRLYTHGVTGISSSSGASGAAAPGPTAAATVSTSAAANASCVRLPASVTQAATRVPLYPAAASLGAAAAAAAFVNYLAACSLDVYDTSRPPCHQRQQTCRTQGETSTRTGLPSSAPNPAALLHHHPALCPHCYTMAREATQLPKSPAARAATHGCCSVARLLLERLMYGVAEPAIMPFSRVRQVYGDARDLAVMTLGALRGPRVEILTWLASGVGAVVLGAALLLWLGLLWGLADLWWVMVDVAVAVLWWYFLWVPEKLLGMAGRVLGHLRRVRV